MMKATGGLIRRKSSCRYTRGALLAGTGLGQDLLSRQIDHYELCSLSQSLSSDTTHKRSSLTYRLLAMSVKLSSSNTPNPGTNSIALSFLSFAKHQLPIVCFALSLL